MQGKIVFYAKWVGFAHSNLKVEENIFPQTLTFFPLSYLYGDVAQLDRASLKTSLVRLIQQFFFCIGCRRLQVRVLPSPSFLNATASLRAGELPVTEYENSRGECRYIAGMRIPSVIYISPTSTATIRRKPRVACQACYLSYNHWCIHDRKQEGLSARTYLVSASILKKLLRKRFRTCGCKNSREAGSHRVKVNRPNGSRYGSVAQLVERVKLRGL